MRLVVSLFAVVSLHAAGFQFNILSVTNLAGNAVIAPGDFAKVTYSVTDPATGVPYDIQHDPAWTQAGVSSLTLRAGWSTVPDFTNRNSGVTSGAALPISVNALGGTVIANPGGTYTVQFTSPIAATATGSGRVTLEGRAAGPDATGALTVRVPIRAVFKDFRITGASVVARRQVVDMNKCLNCHRSDGSGVAPQLTLHGNNRTEQVGLCVVCHNPNNTDISFRLPTDAAVRVGSYTYPEQSVDFKRMIHGIHATMAGFRRTPFVVIAFNHTIFDASTLAPFPGNIRNCLLCHIGTSRGGTFEIPLAAGVLGSSMDTRSIVNGVKAIETDPNNDVNISPIAAVCSSCHDDGETISHMVRTGGASFQTTQAAIDSGAVRERCASCHGPSSGELSVRSVHLD